MFYVVGIIKSKGFILLQKQDRGPVEGYWSGVGGKIQDGEPAPEAMVRQCIEKTGIKTEFHHWNYFAYLSLSDKHDHWGPNYEKMSGVHYFTTEIESIAQIKQIQDEKLQWYSHKHIHHVHTVPNLQWLIPLTNDETTFKPILGKTNDEFL